MSGVSMIYIGLNLPVEDSSTGAETDFHRICSILINRRNGDVTVTFDSYVSHDNLWKLNAYKGKDIVSASSLMYIDITNYE